MTKSVLNLLKSNAKNNYELIINEKTEIDELSYKMIKQMFENQNITISKDDKYNNDIIVQRNNTIISRSNIDKLGDSILYTNSDQYKTQKNQMNNLTFPSSILLLQNEKFNLKGYPKAYNEKLILIIISRYIEQLSYKNGGTHHSTFQKISRINDEKGTKEIYNQLSENVEELHIYGQYDADLKLDGNCILHHGSSDEYKYSWIVIHLSENNAAALAAIENKNKYNNWDAIWTFDREKVISLEKFLENHF